MLTCNPSPFFHPIPTGAKCFICHANASEVDITYTSCCKLPVCDNSHEEYKMMSYSRDFCNRSHTFYTTCSTHRDEDHEGDWRECEECNELTKGVRPFASTNRFCATPCLERFIPQGSMLTYPCDTPSCKLRIFAGHGSITITAAGTICSRCDNYLTEGTGTR